MDGFNEKSTEQVQEQQPLGCLRRFSKTIKVIIIGGLIILLMIPMFMIEDLISERGRTQEEAINEVSEKWSLAQTITGPLSEYPVSGNDREQRGKEDINQGPFLVSGRTSGQWTIENRNTQKKYL